MLFDPPFIMLKTSGNAPTLLLTGPLSSLSATNTTSSSYLPNKSTTQTLIPLPLATPNAVGRQSTLLKYNTNDLSAAFDTVDHDMLMGGLKTRDCKRQHQTAGLENAGLENAALNCSTCKCGKKACMESQTVYFTCSTTIV